MTILGDSVAMVAINIIPSDSLNLSATKFNIIFSPFLSSAPPIIIKFFLLLLFKLFTSNHAFLIFAIKFIFIHKKEFYDIIS